MQHRHMQNAISQALSIKSLHSVWFAPDSHAPSCYDSEQGSHSRYSPVMYQHITQLVNFPPSTLLAVHSIEVFQA